MLEDLGLVEEVIRRGLIEPKFRIWDRASREIIVEFDFGLLKEDTRFPMWCSASSHKLANIAIARWKSHATASMQFSARVSGFAQRDDGVEVTWKRCQAPKRSRVPISSAATADARLFRKALICIRRLYASGTFPRSYDTVFVRSRICATAPEIIFLTRMNGARCSRSVVMTAKGYGEWYFQHRSMRPTTRRRAKRPRSALAAVLSRQAPIHSSIAISTGFTSASLRIPQRSSFPCGDAAHVNNPLGGLGPEFRNSRRDGTRELLGRVLREDADPATLDSTTGSGALNVEYVQQQTIANKKRLEEKDPICDEKPPGTTRDGRRSRRVSRFLLRASLIDAVRRRQTAAL